LSPSLSNILTRLYTNILNRFLDEKFSSATRAGLDFSIRMSSENNLILSFRGYNEKLSLLIDMVTKELRNFDKYLDESVFEVYKADRKDTYKNNLKQGSFMLYLTDFFTKLNFPYTYEYFKVIDTVTVEHLEKFVEKLFSKLRVKMLITGNLSRDDALQISGNVLANIASSPISDVSSQNLVPYICLYNS
jgi:secreted Zn-dependent insulinase-like peptidase